MRTSLKILFSISLIAYGLNALNKPKLTVKAPTSRYHGYELNRVAIRNMKTLTVLVSADGWGGSERGTGVLIDATHVLTCAHVAVNDGDKMMVYFYPGYVLARAHPVFVDKSKDLAIMEIDVPASAAHYATFQEAHYDGEPITVIGNMLGSMNWFVSYGIISGENDRDLFTDGLVHGGNSGGPWINEKGEIVAITDWGLEDHGKESGISGGVSAKTVKKFLYAWKHPSIIDILLGGM